MIENIDLIKRVQVSTFVILQKTTEIYVVSLLKDKIEHRIAMILINICNHQFNCYSRQSNHHQRKEYAIDDELHESMKIETLIIVIFIILIKLFSSLLIIMYKIDWYHVLFIYIYIYITAKSLIWLSLNLIAFD
jgi:hypothetical protein